MSAYDMYVKDEAFLAYYNDYQKQYAGQLAERDKVMLGFIAELTKGQGSLLDIGCSTGNLLLHVKRAFPNLKLHGGELAESSLAAARANPDLSGVALQAMDMLDLPGKYDCITENAVAYLFDWPEYERAGIALPTPSTSGAASSRSTGITLSLDRISSSRKRPTAIRMDSQSM